MMRLSTLFLAAVSLFLGGCGGFLSGVSVKSEKTLTKQPANVMLYLSVEENGQPVDNLSSGNFSIYENDVLLERASMHLELLPRETAADGHTVLLLDLSGDLSESDLARITRGATHFVEKVTTTQAVTVLVFDGSAKPRLVARFPRVETAQDRPFPDLAPFVTGDASRNLNGAILSAIEALTRELDGSKKPLKLGTLVTLARGPDLAERKSDDDVYRAVDASDYAFYALTPQGVKVPNANDFGSDGQYEYDTIDTLPLRMVDLGVFVRKAWKRHYLVTYCTPARSGTRDVKVVIHYTNDRGDERTGRVRTGFEADGFTEGCGPMRPILRARKEAEEQERLAQERAEAEAEAERKRAEEAAEAKRIADEANRKAAAARAAAQRSLEGQKRKEKENPPPEEASGETADEEDEVIAPPSSGGYE